MEPTKYHNLFRKTGVFKYVYKDGNFEIGARDWNDLKFKLAIQKIKLQEKTQEQNKSFNEEITEQSSAEKIQETKIQEIQEQNKSFNEKINKPSPMKKHSNDHSPNYEPLRKNIDYIESEEDIGFGKDRFSTILNTHYSVGTWGPDNSKRARKLREDLIK